MTAPTVQERIAAHNRRLQVEWRYRQAMCGWDDRFHAASDFANPAPSITRDDRFHATVAGLIVALVAVLLIVMLAAAIKGGA